MLLSKNACYSAKSMLLSQKQRRYTYDSIVYARTFTPLTFLIILQLLIKVYLSFHHLIYAMDLKVQNLLVRGLLNEQLQLTSEYTHKLDLPFRMLAILQSY